MRSIDDRVVDCHDNQQLYGQISFYFWDSPTEHLSAYAGDYLKEEIAAEAAVRNVGAFSRFREVAALAQRQTPWTP